MRREMSAVNYAVRKQCSRGEIAGKHMKRSVCGNIGENIYD